MITRENIEEILKINGVTPTAPDEQIRSILLSARYDDDEIDTAITVLRENRNTKKTRIDGLHRVFRTDEALKPSEITELLGIEMDVTDPVEAHAHQRDLSQTQLMIIWLSAIGIAFVGILLYMYLHQIGPFHAGAESLLP